MTTMTLQELQAMHGAEKYVEIHANRIFDYRSLESITRNAMRRIGIPITASGTFYGLTERKFYEYEKIAKESSGVVLTSSERNTTMRNLLLAGALLTNAASGP